MPKLPSCLIVACLVAPTLGACFRKSSNAAAGTRSEAGRTSATESKNPHLNGALHKVRAEELYPLASYIAHCRAALGDVPEFKCAEGFKPEGSNSGHGEDSARCDKPSLNNPLHACVNGNRVNRKVTEFQKNKIDWVLICQRVLPDPMEGRFHGFDLIGYNRGTGETCFFKKAGQPPERTVSLGGHTFSAFDGNAPLADLNDPAKAARDWAMPYGTEGNCTTCHATHPFLRTLVLQGAKLPSGEPLLPPLRKGAPYKVVAREKLVEAYGDFRATDAHPGMKTNADKWRPRRLRSPAIDKACSSCHDVGNENACEMLPDTAFGRFQSNTPQVRVYANALAASERARSEAMRWHFTTYRAKDVTDDDINAALDSIRGCCADPEKGGCTLEDI